MVHITKPGHFKKDKKSKFYYVVDHVKKGTGSL